MATETTKPTVGWLIGNAIMTVVFFPAVTLLLAGDWRWTEGWIFGLWFSAMVLSIVLYTYFKDPALLAERRKAPGSDNQKGWDRYVMYLIYALGIAWLILMPLDARRFGWSPAFPAWLKVVGGLALLPALYLIFRTTAENTFMSTMVRVQTERKQRVISTGPYGFVRHPLYLGCMLMMVGAPLLLGSLVGLIITLIGLSVLVGRIIGEEKVLVNELEGYEDYERKVKYRLIPLVW